MKVLVIGGMGVIGGAITKAAASKGYDVYVLSRRKLSSEWISLGVKGIAGNWLDDDFASEVLSVGYDVIVDTLVFDENRLIKSMKLVDGHCKQYVYISTDSVYPHPAENLSEDEPINSKDIYWDYGIKKRQAELVLAKYGDECSFEWTCIRPTITFGNSRIPVGFASKRGTYTLVQRIIDGRPIVRFDNPSTRHSVCHTSIFGEAVVGLFLNEKGFGQSYHISDDYAYTYDEIFGAIEDILDSKGIYVNVPVSEVRIYSKTLYEEMIYDKNPSFILDNSKIKSVVPNVSYHIDIKKVMESTLSELKKSNIVDEEYNYITDNLILKYASKIDDPKLRQQVNSYLNSFSYDYRDTLMRFRRKRKMLNWLNPLRKCKRTLKNVLRPIREAIK